jgi:hypothetical protein
LETSLTRQSEADSRPGLPGRFLCGFALFHA